MTYNLCMKNDILYINFDFDLFCTFRMWLEFFITLETSTRQYLQKEKNPYCDVNTDSQLVLLLRLFYKLFKINIVRCISIESCNSSCLNNEKFVALIA